MEPSPALLRLLADAVLLVHAAVVVFVVGGLLAVPLGVHAGWPWVRSRVFRGLHLLAIGVVAAQAWLGAICPLTVLENALRRAAGDAPYAASFIEHWVSRLLYHDLPPAVFTAAYTAFLAAVAAAWWRWPPRAGAGNARTSLPSAAPGARP